MSASHAYAWIKANMSLASHLPLNDDVSGLALGGSMSLADTEGLLTMSLVNTGTAATLPTNIDGPFPGTTAISCPNNHIVNTTAQNYAVATLTNVVPLNTSFAFGFWFRPSGASQSAFLQNSSIATVSGDSRSAPKAVLWDSYEGQVGPHARIRDSNGAGTMHYLPYAAAALGWHLGIFSYTYAAAASFAELFIDAVSVGTVACNAGQFGGFACDKFKLWGEKNFPSDTHSSAGFAGALCDAWLVHSTISGAEAATILAQYQIPARSSGAAAGAAMPGLALNVGFD
jgi:hypothetical protein